MMDGKDSSLSIRRQAELLSVNRSSCYYGEPAAESDENITMMNFMDRTYQEHPEAGIRTLIVLMVTAGIAERINPKRMRRLRRKMGLQTLYCRRRTTIPGPASEVRPYLLRNLQITRPNQVWCTDITYIRMGRGFLYLTAIMDWHSRRVLAWRLSNTLDTRFCLEALHEAVKSTGTTPGIMNTDQGCQYTSESWQAALEKYHIKSSMNGRRRWLDNFVVERFWRTIKYDEVYLRDYADGHVAAASIGRFIRYYNTQRPHQSLDYKTPDAVYFSAGKENAA